MPAGAMSTRWVFILLLVLAACDRPSVLPPDVLDRAKFTAVLTDMQLIEARMNHELVVQPRDRVPMAEYYEEAFRSNGVTKEQFAASFDHYAKDPAVLKAIYEEVITELGRRKDQRMAAPTAP
jgi:hypothetical protein